MMSESELREEYERLREHLRVFWMYRPHNTAFYTAYPEPPRRLSRHVEILERLLEIPESERFDYEDVDQTESVERDFLDLSSSGDRDE